MKQRKWRPDTLVYDLCTGKDRNSISDMAVQKHMEQERQTAYNVTLRRGRATIVAVEKQ